MALPGGSAGQGAPQQTINLGELAERVVQGAYSSLKRTLDGLPSKPQPQRLQSLLQYVHNQKQKVLRLRVLVQWANKALAVNACANAWGVAGGHSDAFRIAADHMAYLHEELLHLAIPGFDVHTAWEVLTKGQYKILPTVIDEICSPKPLSKSDRQKALNRINFNILCNLDKVRPPRGMKLMGVSEGIASFLSKGEYLAEVTLVQAPEHLLQQAEEALDKEKDGSANLKDETKESPSPIQRWWWRLMNVRLFAASSKGPPLHPEHLEILKQEIDIRMCIAQEAEFTKSINERKLSNGLASTSGASNLAKNSESSSLTPNNHSHGSKASDVKVEASKEHLKHKDSGSPLVLVHEMLHEISTRLLLSAIRKELRRLVGERYIWEGKLKLAVATRLKPGYRLYYWMETPLVTDAILQGNCASNQSPYLELGTSSNGRVKVCHVPKLPTIHVKDPYSINLDPVSIDVELVLMRAAAMNSQITMGALYDSLKKSCTEENGRKVVLQYWKECFRSKACGSGVAEGGTCKFSPSSTELGSPLLSLYEGVDMVLEVSFHLYDGCFVLEAGGPVKQHLSSHLADKLRVEEDRVNQSWKRWSRDVPLEPNASSIVVAFDKVAGKLWNIAKHLWALVQLEIHFDVDFSARNLGVQLSAFTFGPHLLQEYIKRRPDCSAKHGRHLQIIVPGISLPKSFTHFTCLHQAKSQETIKGIKMSLIPSAIVPQPVKDIRCYLDVNLDAKDKSHVLSMILLGVDAWGVPVQIVDCIPIEQHDPDSDAGDMSPDNQKERVPGGGKIKPRAAGGKRKRGYMESEDDVMRSKKPYTPYFDCENGGLLDDLCTENILGSDDDVLCDENGASSLLQGMLSLPKPQETCNPMLNVIHWCQRRLLWEHILLQLKGLNVPFIEEHHPGNVAGKRAHIVGWTSSPQLLPTSVLQKSMQKTHQLKDAKPDMSFGFEGLESVHIRVPLSSEHSVWVLRINSKVLAQVCGVGFPEEFGEARFSSDDKGVELEYSANKGTTVAVALQDLLRIGCTQRFTAALCDTVENAGQQASHHGLPSWTWPSLSHIRAQRVGLSRVEFVVQTMDSRSFHSSQSTSTAENIQSDQRQLRYTVDWAEREEVDQTAGEACSRDDYEGTKGHKTNTSMRRGKHRDMLPSRINNSNGRIKKRKRTEESSIEEDRLFDDLNWAGVDSTTISGLEFSSAQSYLHLNTSCPHDSVTLSGGDPCASCSDPSETRKVICCITSEPALPAALLTELCQMVDIGEEGLFLDAIGTISGSILTISQALSPAVLQSANLHPGALKLTTSNPPYGFKLLFAKGEKSIAMDIRLYSNGISYFGVNQSRFGGGGSPQALSSLQNNGSGDEVSSITLDMIQGLQRFVEQVRSIPGVQVSQELLGDSFRGPKLAGFGLWCQRSSMALVLKKYIATISHC